MKILCLSSKSETVGNSVLPVKFPPIMPPSKLLLWMAANIANVNVINIFNCAKCYLKNVTLLLYWHAPSSLHTKFIDSIYFVFSKQEELHCILRTLEVLYYM